MILQPHQTSMKNNTAIVLLLLSIGLFYTFTNVQYKSVKDLRELSGEYKSVLRNISAIVSLRDNLFVTYSAIPKTEIDRLNKVLPDNIDTVRLALDLDSMASKYGISIKSVKTSTGTGSANVIVLPENAKSYDTAVVSFSFVARYEDFKRFLGDLESSLRILDVRSVAFQANDTGFYGYQVSVETYWLK